MISVSLGCCLSLYFLEYLVINPFKLTSLDVVFKDDTSSKEISPQHCKNLSFSGAILGFDLGPFLAIFSYELDLDINMS